MTEELKIEDLKAEDRVLFKNLYNSIFKAPIVGDMFGYSEKEAVVASVHRTRFKIVDTDKYTWTPDMVEKIISDVGTSSIVEAEVKEVVKTKSLPNTSLNLSLGVDMNQIFVQAITDYITGNEELVHSRIKKEVEVVVQKLKPTLVQIPERKDVIIDGKVHKKFKEVAFLANSERQVFLVGPAGSGKTTLASQVAKGMNLPFYHLSCSVGMSEAHLLGRMLFDGTYVSSDLVKCYEEGGVFLFDEIDAADPNTLLVINSALANGVMSVPNRKDNPTAKRHKDFICLCAGNTVGNGSVQYSGRNFLDAAFMDRFALSKVEVFYDKELEKTICEGHDDVYNTLNEIRRKVLNNKIQKVISTRAFVSAVRLVKQGSDIEKLKDVLTIGWSDEEKRKCL